MNNKKILFLILPIFIITGCSNYKNSISDSTISQDRISAIETSISTYDLLLNFDKYNWDISRKKIIEKYDEELSDFPSAFDNPTPEGFLIWHKGLPLNKISSTNFSVSLQNDIDSSNISVDTSSGKIIYKNIFSSELNENILDVNVNKNDNSNNFIIYNETSDDFQQATKFTIDGSENYIIIKSKESSLSYTYNLSIPGNFSIIRGSEYSVDIKDGAHIIVNTDLNKGENGIGAISLPLILDKNGNEVEYDFLITDTLISIKIKPRDTTSFPIISWMSISI